MGVGLALLLAFVFCGVVFGEDSTTESACPPTIVDCACTEKDGNFYTIQINTTTISISDEDTGLDRCIADGDPLALCEDRNCIIIPNDNFNILFRKGKKMSPSNYLQEDDLTFENKTSSSISNNTDPNSSSGPSEDVTSPFYPIEFTYPRMIHGEESHQLVKRNNEDSDRFIPPPDSDFGDEKYGRNDHDSFIPPPDRDFEDEKYRKRDPNLYKRPSDPEFGDEKYRKRDPDSFRRPSDPDFEDEKYRKKDTDSLKPPRDPDFRDEKYRKKDNDSFRPPRHPDFGDEKYRKNDPEPFRPARDPDFGDEKYSRNNDAERGRDTSLLRERDDSPPVRPQQEELVNPQSEDNSSFRVKSSSSNSNSAPAYWGGNYGYACRVPQLRNSEVTCWKWPNWQTCKQTCIYGHGIASPKGTLRSTTYTCRNTENQWKPQRMIDCQPYLNCKVRLRSPGDLKCVEPTNRPAYCDIACEEYDNHSAQRVRVTCDEKQGGMRLPFCATLDNSSMNHVRSPSS